MCIVLHRSKTRGLGAGRKLRTHRREQLWADKDYKKSHLGNEWKKPFAGASHAKGIVLEKMCGPRPRSLPSPSAHPDGSQGTPSSSPGRFARGDSALDVRRDARPAER